VVDAAGGQHAVADAEQLPQQEQAAEEDAADEAGPRRSGRERNAPRWLDGYDVGATAFGAVGVGAFAGVSAAGVAASSVFEPSSIEEARASPQWEQWQAAQDSEIESMHSNATWVLEECPRGKKPIPCRWVYKAKVGPSGAVERFKARLVAKGFHQQPGVDYLETFAPVPKPATTRSVLSQAAACGAYIHQLDVKTAFLQGELHDEVYMCQPPGYEDGTGRVCRLHKAVYGLKQAPRAWYEHLQQKLQTLGYVASAADPGLYVRGEGSSRVLLLVYVDDMLIVSQQECVVAAAKEELLGVFDCRDLGEVSSFVGLQVTYAREQRQLSISNPRMIRDLLVRYGMADAKSRPTPMSDGVELERGDGELLNEEQYPYKALVGSLLYIATMWRPDVSTSVGMLARFMSCPTMTHWRAAQGVLRYLAGTLEVGITYGGGRAAEGLQGWCDANWGGDIPGRKSTSGYVFTTAGGAVSWRSKLQGCVAASTQEAEYMAASAAAREAMWLGQLFADMGQVCCPVQMGCDSQSALSLISNPVLSERSKHIGIHYHFVREKQQQGFIRFAYLPTGKNPADMFTKPVPESKHQLCCASIGCG
jgi:histone deacetylase 1/2